MARSTRISVGNTRASAEITGAGTPLERALKGVTKSLREPMESAMREVYAGVKRDWPRPTSSNRTGNKRRQGQEWGSTSWGGFNDIGWASSGYSLKKWRWSTRVGIRNGKGKLVVALTNDATRRGGRYAFMARFPYPHDRKFYWKEYAFKPAKKQGRKLVKNMTRAMTKSIGGA